MKLHKQLLEFHPLQRLAVWLLYLYIRFVFFTAKKSYDIHPDAAPYFEGKKNGIFAYWHGRIMMMPPIVPPILMYVLSSQHRDGVFISGIVTCYKQRIIAGSSSRGGREATIKILRILKKGYNLGITPDGPRGPNQVAAPGVAVIAKLSGKAIIPVTVAAKNHRRIKSWDQFMLAKPFSPMRFCVGAPIMVERGADVETARLAIESTLNQLQKANDALVL